MPPAPSAWTPLAVDAGQVTGALVALGIALAAAVVVDRAFARRGREIALLVGRGELTPEAETRLRFVRRLLVAAVVVIGVALALSQFAGVNRIAASLLASGAIAAAVVGFAARQTLANLVAGIMLAITQPLRVGDWVTFEEEYGQVEDVRLNFTVLRTPADQRVIVPNERLASGILRNETLASESVALDVAVWIPPEADADRALAALEQETGQAAAVAEAVPWGVRLAVGGEPCPPVERPAREADLRARCLRRLRAEGLLDGAGAPAGGARGAAGSARGAAGSAQDPARDQESGPG